MTRKNGAVVWIYGREFQVLKKEKTSKMYFDDQTEFTGKIFWFEYCNSILRDISRLRAYYMGWKGINANDCSCIVSE